MASYGAEHPDLPIFGRLTNSVNPELAGIVDTPYAHITRKFYYRKP